MDPYRIAYDSNGHYTRRPTEEGEMALGTTHIKAERYSVRGSLPGNKGEVRVLVDMNVVGEASIKSVKHEIDSKGRVVLIIERGTR